MSFWECPKCGGIPGVTACCKDLSDYERGQRDAREAFRERVVQWRREWLEENDPCDGTDCVTPFDEYLLS